MENGKFTIKNLTLFENLNFSVEKSSNTTDFEYLFRYQNKVSKAETNPNIKMYLTEEEFLGYGYYGDVGGNQNVVLNSIPKGKYLFLQGIGAKEDFSEIEKAAETLFLEALWQEISLYDTTFLRFIKEGERTVFQLFREMV